MKLFVALFALSLNVAAVEATYYRAWQGFKQNTLSQSQFLAELPAFMQETVDLYRTTHGILSDYMVIIPPKSKPSYVPDELALVALKSIADYQQVRATAAGQNYSARHWDVFDRATSASATMENLGSAVEHNKAYDVLGKPVDWSKGHATAYIGLRKEGLSKSEFLVRLSQHLEKVKRAFSSRGLQGYIIIAHENYEVAYMLWKTPAHMQRAFASVAGQAVVADGAAILNPLMFKEFSRFTPHQAVAEDEALRP